MKVKGYGLLNRTSRFGICQKQRPIDHDEISPRMMLGSLASAAAAS